MAHGPFEHDVGQPRAIAGRGVRHQRAQLRRAIFVAVRPAAVLGQAQPHRIGTRVPVAQQPARLGQVGVGAQAAHLHRLAEQLRAQLVVMLLGAQADADHGLHGSSHREGRIAILSRGEGRRLDRRQGIARFAPQCLPGTAHQGRLSRR
jgi:hypothetical protein